VRRISVARGAHTGEDGGVVSTSPATGSVLVMRPARRPAPPEYAGAADILEALAALPSPEEILALRPSPAFQARVSALLEKSRAGGLSPDEELEWQRFAYLEHLVRLAKAKAALNVARSGDR